MLNLYYNDDITPADYQPPCFRDGARFPHF